MMFNEEVEKHRNNILKKEYGIDVNIISSTNKEKIVLIFEKSIIDIEENQVSKQSNFTSFHRNHTLQSYLYNIIKEHYKDIAPLFKGILNIGIGYEKQMDMINIVKTHIRREKIRKILNRNNE